MKQLIYPLIIFLSFSFSVSATSILIPMDAEQTDHLKAYGFIYRLLEREESGAQWLINYRGGSFMVTHSKLHLEQLVAKGIQSVVISDSDIALLKKQIESPNSNMEWAELNKVAKIALYSPKSASPWDDAVSLALTYAEIPFATIYDEEILDGQLTKYDWVHLHHEDFTGQMGKMYTQREQLWYKKQILEDEMMAKKHGFAKISLMKSQIAQTVKTYIEAGGYLFAMCNATDTFDIALAAQNIDIIDAFYDKDPVQNEANQLMDFRKTLAFTNFTLFTNPRINEFSTIDSSPNYQPRSISEENDFFELTEFSAKIDLIPSMLTQNHESVIHGYMGQTTGFDKSKIKPSITILAENESLNEAKYLYGNLGKGFFSFLGGHDPEDYQHFVNEEHTDLMLHKNSPGYRLILNNVLFPSAKKKKQKT